MLTSVHPTRRFIKDVIELYMMSHPYTNLMLIAARTQDPPVELVPNLFRFIRVSTVNGCIAGQNVEGFCTAGMHGHVVIEADKGLFGMAGELFVSNEFSTAEDAPPTMCSFLVDIAIQQDNLDVLLAAISNAIVLKLAGEDDDLADGIRRFLHVFTIRAARLHFEVSVQGNDACTTTQDVEESAIYITLGSNVLCMGHIIKIPLTFVDDVITQAAGAHAEAVGLTNNLLEDAVRPSACARYTPVQHSNLTPLTPIRQPHLMRRSTC